MRHYTNGIKNRLRSEQSRGREWGEQEQADRENAIQAHIARIESEMPPEEQMLADAAQEETPRKWWRKVRAEMLRRSEAGETPEQLAAWSAVFGKRVTAKGVEKMLKKARTEREGV